MKKNSFHNKFPHDFSIYTILKTSYGDSGLCFCGYTLPMFPKGIVMHFSTILAYYVLQPPFYM